MKFLGKIKSIFKEVVNEHRYSFGAFMLSMILWAITAGDNPAGDVLYSIFDFLKTIEWLLFSVSFGLLLCESIHLYKKDTDSSYDPKSKKVLGLRIVIIATTFLSALQFRILDEYIPESFFKVGYEDVILDLSRNILFFVGIAVIGLIIYFFYKRSGECSETYVAKAFCGLMKAELVYGIIALGALLIIWAFDTLIFDTFFMDLTLRVEILLLGLVEFPCAVVGLSKTEGEISKFGRIVLSYIFTGIIAVAFAVIYVYIIKIFVTWTFPSNEVFPILTALFVCGLFAWTMAFGCCDEGMRRAISILPFLFIPFIILQIMCLYMRVRDYGLTSSRYFGIIVIVFEIIYFVIYTLRFIRKKDYIFTLIFIVIAGVFIVLFMPGINVYSAVTMSQKGKIIAYLEQGSNTSDDIKKDAHEAYKVLDREGGFSGRLFIDNKLSKDQMSDLTNNDYHDDAERTYINVYNDMNSIDVTGFTRLSIVETDLSDWAGITDIDNIPIYLKDDESEPVDYVDFCDIVDTLKEYEKKNVGQTEKENVIQKKITTKNGKTLVLTKVNIFGFTENDEMDIRSFEIRGYLLE